MKIKLFCSTLSCILKCIRFLIIVINKKIIFGLFIFVFLGACTSPTAMLGPAYTLTASGGNVFQAGFSYGSGELIKNHTGKTTVENIKEISLKTEIKNVKKRTLESEDFYILVKNKIKKTSGILNLANQ